MKVNDGFILRKVGDEFVVITMDEALKKFNGMIKLNDTGAFIFEKIKEGITMENLISCFAKEYSLTEEQAKTDINQFLESVKQTECFDLN